MTPTDKVVDPAEARWEHNELVTADVPVIGRKLYTPTATPLDAYFHKSLIAPEQWAAGDQVRKFWHFANIEPRVTTRMDDTRGGEQTISDLQLFGREKLKELSSVMDVRGWQVIMAVSCWGETAGDWAKGKGERREYGMGRLREALFKLSDYLKTGKC